MVPTLVENSKFFCVLVKYYYCMQFGGHYIVFNDVYNNLNQNSKAVKKKCGPQKGQGEKRCEIQGGSQEMTVMVG